MTITIIATPGASDANSFVTIEEADAYLATRLNASDWTGTEPKKKAACEATRELSALGWQSYRTSSTQALAWPRLNAPNPDGTSACEVFEDTIVPQRIKDATCELALEFLRAGTIDAAALDSKAGIIEKTVGPLTTRYADPSQRAQGLARYPRVMKLIGPLLGIAAGQVRLTR